MEVTENSGSTSHPRARGKEKRSGLSESKGLEEWPYQAGIQMWGLPVSAGASRAQGMDPPSWNSSLRTRGQWLGLVSPTGILWGLLRRVGTRTHCHQQGEQSLLRWHWQEQKTKQFQESPPAFQSPFSVPYCQSVTGTSYSRRNVAWWPLSYSKHLNGFPSGGPCSPSLFHPIASHPRTWQNLSVPSGIPVLYKFPETHLSSHCSSLQKLLVTNWFSL